MRANLGRRAILALTLAALAAAALSPAWAHRPESGREAPIDSIVIPNLTHGQMKAMADNRAAILDLAARQSPTDPTMRRLQAFVSLQYFGCAWGLVPGSIEDESSPFNECSHAYLAATRALLLHLQEMPGDRSAVRALIAKVEREMLDNSASLVMCRYSDEPFNTAERIAPHWAEIPFHPASLATFSSLALIAAGCAWIGVGRRHRSRTASGRDGLLKGEA